MTVIAITQDTLDAVSANHYEWMQHADRVHDITAEYCNPFMEIVLQKLMAYGARMQTVAAARTHRAANASASSSTAFSNATPDRYDNMNVGMREFWVAAFLQHAAELSLELDPSRVAVGIADLIEQAVEKKFLKETMGAVGAYWNLMEKAFMGYPNGAVAQVDSVSGATITLVCKPDALWFRRDQVVHVAVGSSATLDSVELRPSVELKVDEAEGNETTGVVTFQATVPGSVVQGDLLVPAGNANKSLDGLWSWLLLDAADARTRHGWDQSLNPTQRAGIRIPMPDGSTIADMLLKIIERNLYRGVGMGEKFFFLNAPGFTSFLGELDNPMTVQELNGRGMTLQGSLDERKYPAVKIGYRGMGGVTVCAVPLLYPYDIPESARLGVFTSADNWEVMGAGPNGAMPGWIDKGGPAQPGRIFSYQDGQGRYGAEYQGHLALRPLNTAKNIVVGDSTYVKN